MPLPRYSPWLNVLQSITVLVVFMLALGALGYWLFKPRVML